jgi:AraC-like DNA-binding protein
MYGRRIQWTDVRRNGLVATGPAYGSNAFSAHNHGPNFLARGGLAPAVLRRVCEHMAARLHDDVALNEPAALGDLTPNHFEVAFKQPTGVAPHAWVRRRRIDGAKRLLRNSEAGMATCRTSRRLRKPEFIRRSVPMRNGTDANAVAPSGLISATCRSLR